MITLNFDLATGTVKLAQPATIKLGADVPVRVVFSAAPGEVSLLAVALATPDASAAVLAFTDGFAEESARVWTALLDASDTRLAAWMEDKTATAVSLELRAVLDGANLLAPNVSLTVQPAALDGPASSSTGPDYYTDAETDAAIAAAIAGFDSLGGLGNGAVEKTGTDDWVVFTVTTAAKSVLDDTTTDAMLATLAGAAPTGTGALVRATSPDLGGTPTISGAAIATQSYVSSAISSLIAGAPGALDTLDELAAAFGDDANFAATTATALGNRLRIDASVSLTSDQKNYGRTNLGLGAAQSVTFQSVTIAGNQGLLLTPIGSNFLVLRCTDTSFSANRILNFSLGDANRTLTLAADATISGTNTGDQTSVSGNAGTATALQTARSIFGVSFDGTANIGSRSGNTTEVATVSGAKTTGKQLAFDASGNVIASASDIGGGGSGITMWTATVTLTRDQTDTSYPGSAPVVDLDASGSGLPMDGILMSIAFAPHGTFDFEFDDDASATYTPIDITGVATYDDLCAAVVAAINSHGTLGSILTASYSAPTLTLTGGTIGSSETITVSGGWATGYAAGSDAGGSPAADGDRFVIAKAAESGKKHYILDVAALNAALNWNNGIQVGYGPNEGGFDPALAADALTASAFVVRDASGFRPTSLTMVQKLGESATNTAVAVLRLGGSAGEAVDGGTSQTITVRINGFTV